MGRVKLYVKQRSYVPRVSVAVPTQSGICYQSPALMLDGLSTVLEHPRAPKLVEVML